MYQMSGKGQTVLCSTDKDLNMIPGKHFNFVTGELYTINEAQALRNFYGQLLSGDPTDNIEGIPGIGPAKADKLLNGAETEADYFRIVYEAYSTAFAGEGSDPRSLLDRILETGQLLWIWRKPNDIWQLPEWAKDVPV
jgi:5'-3' exonuclease